MKFDFDAVLFCRRPALTNHSMNAIIPLFHHSIIPVMVWKNASVEIPYYQQFVEFPGHLIIPANLSFDPSLQVCHPSC